LNVFLPIAIGGILAVLLFSKLMEHLLETKHSRVYHFILGLVIASTVLILIPNPASEETISYANISVMTIVLSIVLFGLGVLLGSWMSKLEEKYK
jgi:putative membrane protein